LRLLDPAASLGAWSQVPARQAELYRLDATIDGRAQAFYVKCYQPAGVSSWPRHAADLTAMRDALAGVGPSVVVATSAEHRVLLTRRVSGARVSAVHRFAGVLPWRRSDVVSTWTHIGQWLAVLHQTGRPEPSPAECAAQVRDVAITRFERWAAMDAVGASLAPSAIDATRHVHAALPLDITVGLSHGDVSSGNILLTPQGPCLIDYDDLRVDLPGLDCSQAELELLELTRLEVAGPGDTLTAAKAGLIKGYGPGYPSGPALWLPHLRNLAVYLVTLAAGGATTSPWRRGATPRYRRTIRALRGVLREVTAAGLWRANR
jgi:Ser/Thr protein kinase RdoA (MazF antagonist)